MSSQGDFQVPTGHQVGENRTSAPGCTCTCCCRLNVTTLDSRWLLLSKVLSRLTVQMGITVLLVSIIVFSRPIASFLTAIPVCLVLYISALVLPLTVMGHHYQDILDHPVQFFFLGLLTAILTFTLALSCSITEGFHIFGTYKEPGCFPTDLIRNCCCCSNPLDGGIVKGNVFGLGKTFLILLSGMLCGVILCLWYQSNCAPAPGASPTESHNTHVPSPTTTENPANTIERNSAASVELPTIEVQLVQSHSTLENIENTMEQNPSVEVVLQPERLQETPNHSASDESPTVENLFLSSGLGNAVNEAADGASTEVQSEQEEQKMAGVGELACTYAALILHDDGIPITPERINLIVKAANLKIDTHWPALFTKLLEKRSIEDLILSCGLGSTGEAVGKSSGGGGAPAEEEEKSKEES